MAAAAAQAAAQAAALLEKELEKEKERAQAEAVAARLALSAMEATLSQTQEEMANVLEMARLLLRLGPCDEPEAVGGDA